MTYKHLAINGTAAYLLGYELALTPSERTILLAVADGGKTASELHSLTLRLRRTAVGTVVTHICAINKKARDIGGRRLILCRNGKYILNEFM